MPFLKEIGHWYKVEEATNFATSGPILDFMSKFILSELFLIYLCVCALLFLNPDSQFIDYLHTLYNLMICFAHFNVRYGAIVMTLFRRIKY